MKVYMIVETNSTGDVKVTSFKNEIDAKTAIMPYVKAMLERNPGKPGYTCDDVFYVVDEDDRIIDQVALVESEVSE